MAGRTEMEITFLTKDRPQINAALERFMDSLEGVIKQGPLTTLGFSRIRWAGIQELDPLLEQGAVRFFGRHGTTAHFGEYAFASDGESCYLVKTHEGHLVIGLTPEGQVDISEGHEIEEYFKARDAVLKAAKEVAVA